MILPAAIRHLGTLYAVAPASRAVAAMCDRVSELVDKLSDAVDELERAVHGAHEAREVSDEARIFVKKVIPAQNTLREVADELETLVADDLWPLPKYRELLFQY